MAKVTGLTAARMLEIENASIVDARLNDYDLILTNHEGQDINVGNVRGPQGPEGPIETPATIGAMINSAADKASPVDADRLPLMDSEAGNVIKKFSWLSVKNRLKEYFDTLYSLSTHTHDGRYYTKTQMDLELPIGIIHPYAGPTAPSGWLLANGNAFSAASYPKLAALILNTYGGTLANPCTPNLSGRVPLGVYSGITNMNAIGKMGGEFEHTLTWGEMPVHSHEQYVTANPNSGGTGVRADYNSDNASLSAYPQGISTGNSGLGAAHNNTQPYTVINFIIRAA